MTTSGSHPPDPARQPGQHAGTDQAQVRASGPESDPAARPARDGQTRQLGQLPRLGPDLASAAWPAFLAAGIGAIIIGAILLAWPKETLKVVAILIGAALIVAGLLRLIDGFTAHESTGGKRVASVVIGLIAVILGLYCIRHYHLTIAALAIIVGLFWVIHGISDIAAGLFIGRIPGRWLTVLSGVLSLAAGLVVLFWPTISLTVFVAIIGIWLIVYGVIAAILSFMLRRDGQSGSGSGPGRLAPV